MNQHQNGNSNPTLNKLCKNLDFCVCKFPVFSVKDDLWCVLVFVGGVVSTGAVLHPCSHALAGDMAVPTVPPSGLEDIQLVCDGHGGIIQLLVDQWVPLPSLYIHSDWVLCFFKTLYLITWPSVPQSIWTLCQCITKTFCWTWWMNGLGTRPWSLCPITSPAWMTRTSGVGGVI